MLDKGSKRELLAVDKISFLTQRLLLTALYEGWKDISAANVAQKLDVSRMSVTRCFDEIEACHLPYISISRRSRRFTADTDKKEMWNAIRRFLRNPVTEKYSLRIVPDGKAIDPLTAILSLSDSELSDPRVNKAIDDMLEEYVW